MSYRIKRACNYMTLQEIMPICTKNYDGQRDDFGRFLSGENHPMKTLELREKSRISHKGQVPWTLGKAGTYHFSEQAKKNMSIAQKARPKHPNSINTLKLLAIKSKGIPLSENHKQNMSKSWNYDKHFTPIVKDKLKQARRKRVLPLKDTKPERIMQIALSLNGIEFEKHKAFNNGRGFYHQVDLFIEPNICIEVDGDYWHSLPKTILRDKEIDLNLNLLGYKVIRLSESDIKKDAYDLILKIMGYMMRR